MLRRARGTARETPLRAMASNPPQALRLTFSYQGGRTTLLGVEHVAAIVPAPAIAAPEAGQTGYWFEVRDATGTLLYHRALHSPIRIDTEAFSQDPRASITRVPLDNATGRFTVLIPDVPEARTFTLHGPLNVARPDEPAQEIVRIGVDTLRRTKPPQLPGGASPSPGRTG